MNRNFEKAVQKPDQIDTVIIPIAGKGTRLLPKTKAVPKHFQTVGDYPLIQYAVEEAKAAGIKKFIFIIDGDPLSQTLLEKHFLPQPDLDKHLAEKGMTEKLAEVKSLELQPEQLVFVVQDTPTGMWDALERAKPHVTGDAFAVISPDDLFLPAQAGLPDLAKHHRPGAITISVEKTPMEDISKFGVVSYTPTGEDGVFEINGVVEKPPREKAPSDMAIAGRYILPVSIFEKFKPVGASVKKEISISHAIQGVNGDIPAHAVQIQPGAKFDAGSRQGIALANMHVYAQDAEIGPTLEKIAEKKPAARKTRALS